MRWWKVASSRLRSSFPSQSRRSCKPHFVIRETCAANGGEDILGWTASEYPDSTSRHIRRSEIRMARILSHCHSILDLRHCARSRVPSPIFHWLDGSAETEVTAQRNTAAFDEDKLIPRCLDD